MGLGLARGVGLLSTRRERSKETEKRHGGDRASGDQAVVFEDRGSGRPAFVFVHGWACDRSFFAPQAEHFARRHRVVSVDLRGHGESDKPPGPYPIAAEDIAYIIEELGLGKTVAVGHSMGGMIVLQLAAAHPDCVAAIVMVDSTLVFSPERRAAFETVAAGIEAGDHGSRTQFIKSMFIPTSDQQLVENVTAVMLAAPPHIAAAAIRGSLEFDCQAAAALCKAPALHLAALPRRMLPQSITERLPNLLNGCTVGAGHFQANAMIESFLRHYV
jgi:pimeloyl-ACP methyl ester carboxylesterase